MKAGFVETHKTKLAMLGLGKLLMSGTGGSMFDSLFGILAGAGTVAWLAFKKGFMKPVLGFFTKTIPAAAEHLFVKFGVQILDLGKMSKLRLFGVFAAVMTFADGAINSIANVFTGVTNVIKAGGSFGDQMIATGLGIYERLRRYTRFYFEWFWIV